MSKVPLIFRLGGEARCSRTGGTLPLSTANVHPRDVSLSRLVLVTFTHLHREALALFRDKTKHPIQPKEADLVADRSDHQRSAQRARTNAGNTARQVLPARRQATAHAKPPPTRRRHPRHALPTRCRRPTRRALSRSEQHIVTQRHAARPTQSHTSRCQNSAATYRGDRTARPQRLSAPSVSAPGGYRLPRCAPETTTTCPTCPACPVPAPLRAPATWAGRPPSHSWPELWR